MKNKNSQNKKAKVVLNAKELLTVRGGNAVGSDLGGGEPIDPA